MPETAVCSNGEPFTLEFQPLAPKLFCGKQKGVIRDTILST
jgi:hypothetical protein